MFLVFILVSIAGSQETNTTSAGVGTQLTTANRPVCPPCNMLCVVGSHCECGKCVKDVCPVCNMLCMVGFHCECGKCVKDVCPPCNLMCLVGFHCECGKCVKDACKPCTVMCSPGTHCVCDRCVPDKCTKCGDACAAPPKLLSGVCNAKLKCVPRKGDMKCPKKCTCGDPCTMPGKHGDKGVCQKNGHCSTSNDHPECHCPILFCPRIACPPPGILKQQYKNGCRMCPICIHPPDSNSNSN